MFKQENGINYFQMFSDEWWPEIWHYDFHEHSERHIHTDYTAELITIKFSHGYQKPERRYNGALWVDGQQKFIDELLALEEPSQFYVVNIHEEQDELLHKFECEIAVPKIINGYYKVGNYKPKRVPKKKRDPWPVPQLIEMIQSSTIRTK